MIYTDLPNGFDDIQFSLIAEKIDIVIERSLDDHLDVSRLKILAQMPGCKVFVASRLPTDDMLGMCLFCDTALYVHIFIHKWILECPPSVLRFIVGHELAHATEEGRRLYRIKDCFLEQYCDSFSFALMDKADCLEAIDFLNTHKK
jgi:hypothetical protein